MNRRHYFLFSGIFHAKTVLERWVSWVIMKIALLCEQISLADSGLNYLTRNLIWDHGEVSEVMVSGAKF